MKKFLLVVCAITLCLAGTYAFHGSRWHKLLAMQSAERRGDLLRWVDTKSSRGYFSVPAKTLVHKFHILGDYSVDIDFDLAPYGLSKDAVARVVTDKNSRPASVVFIDKSTCGIAIALHSVSGGTGEIFGDVPSDTKTVAPRIGFFCLGRRP